MLGSFDEAEDLVQETLLRAWRARASFGDRQLMRAGLCRIATNACLDALRRSRRQLTALGSFAEVPWLQPYPDRLLDELAPPRSFRTRSSRRARRSRWPSSRSCSSCRPASAPC